MFRYHSIFRLAITGLLAVALTGFGCGSTSQQTDSSGLDEDPQQIAQEQFVRANEALDNQDWQRAIDHYRQATDADPDRWQAHLNRAIALGNLREHDRAVEAIADALAVDGADRAAIYFNLGNLYQNRSMYEAAIDAYRSSMGHRDRLHYETLLNISACFTFLNALDEARQTAQRAIELEPDDPRGRLTLGVIQYTDDQPDQALDLYNALIAERPDFAPAHYNRGFVLLRLGELVDARRAFQSYLDRAPDGPYAEKAQNHIITIDDRLER